MKKRIIIPILLLIAALGTSCVSQHNVERNYSELRPDVIRLYMTMDDYQYLGDVTIDIEYKTYLGIFRKILTVNGEPYDPRYYHNTQISFTHKIKLGLLKKSLYKVAQTFPEADYLMPVSFNDDVQHMPGGRIHKQTMIIKAYAVNKVSAKAVEEQQKAEVETLNSQNAALQAELEATKLELEAAKVDLQKAKATASQPTNRRR